MSRLRKLEVLVGLTSAIQDIYHAWKDRRDAKADAERARAQDTAKDEEIARLQRKIEKLKRD